jgi:hypothetical protein
MLLAIVIHTSLAAFTFYPLPSQEVVANIISGLAAAAALWIFVAAVAIANGGHNCERRHLARRLGHALARSLS